MIETNEKVNPSEGDFPDDFVPIPMTSGTLRLAVPARAGYHRHWFRGTPERIARAKAAGYRMVSEDSVKINNFDLGGDAKRTGNSDLGSSVSVITGEDADNSGQPSRLYLMECRDEHFALAQKALYDRNESIADALRGGKIGAGQDGETDSDISKRYANGIPDLFNPNKKRRT